MGASLLLLLVLQDPATTNAPRSEWFPEGLVYRHPLADPRAPVSGVQLQFPVEAEDDFKIENRLGTHVAIWRTSNPDSIFEIQAEGGVFARFNFDENWDMDAADFRFGMPVVARTGPVAFKLHAWHLTSHLGDEFIERTGRKRIVYARNEIALGASWDFLADWRAYGEAGYALSMGDVNEPLRFMTGVETVGRYLGASGPEVFGALNMTSFEEQDWHTQFNFEVGVWLHREVGSPRGIRFTLGYYTGPSALTQFFDEYEKFWTLGFTLTF